MIRVRRGHEPWGLARARANRIPAAVAAYHRRGAPSSELAKLLVKYGSKATKRTLFLAHHKKCAWCERRRDLSSSHAEHYRPKNGADRHMPGAAAMPRDQDRYWWLTWTWENLLFSCPRCNDAGHKANFFPLESGTKPLAIPPAAALKAHVFSTTEEAPLLVDPATDDPLDHISWRPIDPRQPRRAWIWTPRALTTRGDATIKILKLAELADEAGDHLNNLLATIIELEREINSGQLNDARKRWETLLQRVFKPECSFHAVSYCALDLWVPLPTRTHASLAPLCRPGAPA